MEYCCLQSVIEDLLSDWQSAAQVITRSFALTSVGWLWGRLHLSSSLTSLHSCLSSLTVLNSNQEIFAWPGRFPCAYNFLLPLSFLSQSLPLSKTLFIAQILGFSYDSPIKEIRTPWRIGWYWSRKHIRWPWSILQCQKIKTCFKKLIGFMSKGHKT